MKRDVRNEGIEGNWMGKRTTEDNGETSAEGVATRSWSGSRGRPRGLKTPLSPWRGGGGGLRPPCTLKKYHHFALRAFSHFSVTDTDVFLDVDSKSL